MSNERANATDRQGRPSSAKTTTGRARGSLLLLALCLLTPSFWLLATVPPLWRDADAYNQLLHTPAQSTSSGHGLLYGLSVRVPLYVGYTIERKRGAEIAATTNFFDVPVLTDTGIGLLIVAQHVALAGAGLALILLATSGIWMRFALAFFFASNHLFYTFAHCVGSESLSMICLLLLAALGLRLVRHPEARTWKIWSLFAVVLFACLTTRYVNMLLAFLLPLTFLVLAMMQRDKGQVRHAAISILIGAACLVLARSSAEAVSRAGKFGYYSRIGFTFMWRVGFVQTVPEQQRAALLDRVAARTKAPDAQQVFAILREIIAEGKPLGSGTIFERVRAALPRAEKRSGPRRVHTALNTVAWAFLLPPTAEHWQTAQEDFSENRRLLLPEVSRFLFATTVYLWEYADKLPGVGHLSTFRENTPAGLMEKAQANPYLGLWSGLTLNGALLGSATSLGALVMVSVWHRRAGTAATAEGENRARDNILPIAVFAGLLVLMAMAMVEATALVGDLIPRYTLPLWEMAWVTGIIAVGGVGDALRSVRWAAGKAG